MNTAKIIVGDNRETLKQLPDQSVQCVVTSPPYWGLRDYGTGTWVGGDQDCSHRRESKKSDKTITGHKNFTEMLGVGDAIYKDVCPRCGSVREDNQIGLEQTPDEFIEQLCLVFDEVWRVLAEDGTVWVNLGDTYYEKSLAGIPWRFAFAMQARGWYLRQDIIWAKPNPMPESVTDRCTKSHEYIFLLTKSSKYYFDNEAIKEPAVGTGMNDNGIRSKRDVWTVATKPYKEAHFATFPTELVLPCVLAGTSEKGNCADCGKSYVRLVERPEPPQVDNSDLDRFGDGKAGVHRKVGQAYQNWLNENPAQTIGWAKQCSCETDQVVPAVVLDPFSGSGTIGEVALTNGRNYFGTELNPEYAALSERRISDAVGMFGEVEVV